MPQTPTTAESPTRTLAAEPPLLRVDGLRTYFELDGRTVKAVDDISFEVSRGRCHCLVGESGSGKSITARSVLGLIESPGRIVSGSVLWSGTDPAVDLTTIDPRSKRMRSIRGAEIAMVFQEPMASLSPMYTIGDHLVEAIRNHRELTKKQAAAMGVELLDRVGIRDPQGCMSAYSFQLSGGMCQRAMIAVALSAEPKLLIADEPTTALDVTTQARIIRLLRDLQAERNLALLFITHDFGVVAEMADDVSVMRHGKIVESGPVDTIFHEPEHPYTQRLLASLPKPGTRRLQLVETAPDPIAPETPLIKVRSVAKRFPIRGSGVFARVKGHHQVLTDVSLELHRGEVLGLVGESGSGKTTLGRCIVGAYQPDSGSVLYHRDSAAPVDIVTADRQVRRRFQQDVRMVFQDPFGSLNPRLTILQIIGDPLIVNKLAAGSELEDRVAEMLSRVGLPRRYLRRYPHAFSGGERQRIGIARALIVDPTCVIADEAVSALDMSVRAQVLELMERLRIELNLTYLFISHDLSVVESICDRVAVMYAGDIVELGEAEQIFGDPQHSYTRELLAAAPKPDPRLRSA
ncbi:ABC transporter ATP-binding protein [Microlunatus speluncae]|uniref:ABC transporter ATP-binding protein n=1 Tax=Microlunatus speluncae TaxID=2594267 RepID=UPI00126687CA|nr:ABC transporter ATP-binding protein [Microlunatus speluncae]